MMDSVANIVSVLFSRTPGVLSFTSVQYIIFFTVLYAIFTIAPAKKRVRNLILLVFSLYYYFRMSGQGIVILFFISLSDFLIATWIHKAGSENRKKHLVLLSLFVDVGSLGYFKYANFFLGQYQSLFNSSGIFIPLSIIVPLGISYYIFKSLGYVLDVYRGMIDEPERDFSVYLLYTSFFPTIIAGPISRARDLLPQFNAEIKLTEQQISRALFLIMTGLIKKIVIADFIAANFLDRVLETPNYFSGFENLMALIAAPLQVYSDFSGYTDMALGFALLFGLEIKNNFNFPFRAKTVTDFWRRWHITLLDWFNEYIFSPVSLSLRGLGKPAVAIAILVTFLVSGFWHGAAWTFIVWGLLHGLMLILEYFTAAWREEGIKKKQHQGRRSFWAVVTFLFIAASFVLFKCNSLDNAWTVIEKIFSGFDEDIISDWVSVYYGVLIVMVAGYVMHYLPERISTKLQMKFRQLHWAIQAIIVACVIYFVYQVIATDTKPFIYLEF